MTNHHYRIAIFALVVLNILLLRVFAAIGQDVVFDPTRNTVSLVWDANTEPDMHHYTVYIHRGDTTAPAWVVTHPATTADEPVPVRSFYERIGFSLTATDQAGNESAHSDTVTALFCAEAGRVYADVNGDGLVDVEDLELVRASLGALPWYVGWRDAADLDASGKIDVEDLELCRTRLGRRL